MGVIEGTGMFLKSLCKLLREGGVEWRIWGVRLAGGSECVARHLLVPRGEDREEPVSVNPEDGEVSDLRLGKDATSDLRLETEIVSDLWQR
jgi:hypothetical protein